MALIRNISDTALLAAIYRARESERADLLFRDPFARRLAGERGEEIARSLVFSEKNAWAWFASRLGADARQALVISEGLIVYLTAAAAGALAEDLSQQASFRHWLLDLASPALLKMMQKKMGQPLAQAAAPLKFAPLEGPDFFQAHGWQAREVHSMFHTAGSLKRLPLMLSFFYRLQKSDAFQANRPWSGACLLENVSNPNN